MTFEKVVTHGSEFRDVSQIDNTMDAKLRMQDRPLRYRFDYVVLMLIESADRYRHRDRDVVLQIDADRVEARCND